MCILGQEQEANINTQSWENGPIVGSLISKNVKLLLFSVLTPSRCKAQKVDCLLTGSVKRIQLLLTWWMLEFDIPTQTLAGSFLFHPDPLLLSLPLDDQSLLAFFTSLSLKIQIKFLLCFFSGKTRGLTRVKRTRHEWITFEASCNMMVRKIREWASS